MSDDEWAYGLHRRLHANFPAFTYDDVAADAWVEWVADLGDYQEEVAAAARALLAKNTARMPMGADVRRRFLQGAGLLAPSWPEAHRMIGDASAGRRSWRDLPGPVRVLTDDDAHADYLKAVEERYMEEAEAHDDRVLAPGGIAEVIAAAAWIDAVRVRTDRVVLARQAQYALDLPILDVMSDDEADASIAAWRAVNGGETPALPSGPVLDADEKWTPADNVRSLIERLRPKMLGRGTAGGAA